MNFKERIETINQLKEEMDSSFKIKSEVELSDIFVKNKTVDQILKTALVKSKNVLLLCQSACDRTVVASYVRSLFLNNNIQMDVLTNLADDLPFSSSERVIVPEPSLSDLVKIFELILLDYKSFIFTLNLKTFINPIESLRVLLLLNSPNLNANNVDHLIGMSDALLLYVEKNDDGLFEVTNVGKIQYRNSRMFLDVIYGSSEQVEQDEFVQTQELSSEVRNEEKLEENVQIDGVEEQSFQVEEITADVQDEQQNNSIEDETDNTTISDVEESVDSSLNEENEEITNKKVNKYKLLKEKLKSKKKSE